MKKREYNTPWVETTVLGTQDLMKMALESNESLPGGMAPERKEPF